jgi:hypothetical protein
MRPPRIEAVDRVVLEASPHCRDALRAFYGELVGLEELDCDPPDAGLRFGARRLDLYIRFVDSPEVDALSPRLVIGVGALTRMESELNERSMKFRRRRGLSWTDRRLVLLDPAGHRIELKQEWPPVF